MVELSLVYVTAESIEAAEKIARDAVARRLAACANILPGMVSLYHWNGVLERASECVLVLKTRNSLIEALTARILELHSYEAPCVLSIPVQGGSADYLAWLLAETETR